MILYTEERRPLDSSVAALRLCGLSDATDNCVAIIRLIERFKQL